MNKILFIIILTAGGLCFAECPLDHFLIGCNQDGITGTADDNELFVDCSEIYRHSDPANNQNPTWLYWHYPLYYSVIYHDYSIGEPGFDTIKADDPNHCLSGTPMVDYDIIIEVVSISPTLRGVFQGSPAFTLSQVGDSFNHSSFSDPHMHFTWRAPTNTQLCWIAFQMYDAKNKYLPSEPFSIVFNTDPCAGDLVIDGKVNMTDFVEFCNFWLQDNGNRSNDFYQRADANRDGKVDFEDFCLLAANWLAQ
ncbi:MAG: dockerin type I domain-containing protein [Sedimentisphaerales bacterium]